MRVVGVDPGLRLTGYGCVDGRSGPMVSKPALVEAGIFRLRGSDSVGDRLVELDRDLDALLDRTSPDLLAVEKLYAHYKHPTTAIIMGHARGVILLCARRRGIEIRELGATEVKKSTTGHGHASKSQMQSAIAYELGLLAPPEPADVADALAIALCGLRRASDALAGDTIRR